MADLKQCSLQGHHWPPAQPQRERLVSLAAFKEAAQGEVENLCSRLGHTPVGWGQYRLEIDPGLFLQPSVEVPPTTMEEMQEC